MLASLKSTTWRLLGSSYHYSGLPRLRHRGRVAILTYHRVVSDDMVRNQHIQAGMYVTVQSFERQIAYLKSQFALLSFEDLLQLWRAGRVDHRMSYCVLTFDDGWRDNYDHAFPVLKKHGVPATIFLATDYVGTDRWFWPDQITFLMGNAWKRWTSDERRRVLASLKLEMSRMGKAVEELAAFLEQDLIDVDALIEACKKLHPDVVSKFVAHLSRVLGVDLPTGRVLLNWKEVREMASHGIAFGSHSCSHRLMTDISDDEARKELKDSWQALLAQGIKPVPVFCYPNGSCDNAKKAVVRESGYLAAVGCEVGLEGEQPGDLFDLKRVSLHEDRTSSLPLFSLTLSCLR